MHTRKYIIKDGELTLPVGTSSGYIQLRALFPGDENYTVVNTNNFDFISYEYIIGPSTSTSLVSYINLVNIKLNVTIRRKRDGKIFTGVSAGVDISFANGAYPVLQEV